MGVAIDAVIHVAEIGLCFRIIFTIERLNRWIITYRSCVSFLKLFFIPVVKNIFPPIRRASGVNAAPREMLSNSGALNARPCGRIHGVKVPMQQC